MFTVGLPNDGLVANLGRPRPHEPGYENERRRPGNALQDMTSLVCTAIIAGSSISLSQPLQESEQRAKRLSGWQPVL
jgi:hypothetical protein